jgi:hypothetical protein
LAIASIKYTDICSLATLRFNSAAYREWRDNYSHGSSQKKVIEVVSVGEYCMGPTAAFSELGDLLAITEFFDERVLAALLPPDGESMDGPRFRVLKISVFMDIGLGMPCNFMNRPQALQRGWPLKSLRQRGVLFVEQFVQVI